MAHHKSAQKRIRQTETRAARNKSRLSRVRTFVKRVYSALEAKDTTAADAALRDAQRELAKGVTKGVIKSQTASRKTSRLAAEVKALKASA